jgi:RNA polymerase sigma-70 factor (ECF subfamily)
VEPDDQFARLIAPIKSRMLETVWRILRHAQDAEDALQTALTNIWQQRDRVEGHPAPQALMLKICADTAIDHYRRRRSSQVDLVALEDYLASARPLPVDAAIGRETLEILLEAISKLSPNQATAIVMRFIQGESDTAIAAALDCGVETVREHLHRGRERLGRMLGRLSPQDAASSNPTTTHLHTESK